MKKFWWYAVLIVFVGLAGWWLVSSVTVTAPGVSMPDQGREHVTAAQVASYSYNSNPPTSGPHLATWVKPGIYQAPQNDGELIHSLEHGYVIISYNCGVHLGNGKTDTQGRISMAGWVSDVFAHEEAGERSTTSADLSSGQEIATGSAIAQTQECTALIAALENIVRSKKLFKLIMVARPQLDTTIALTAWGAIDKFDADSESIDKERIEAFIDYYRDHGPEKTME